MKKYEYKEFIKYMCIKSDYKCGAWKFRDDIIKILNELGQEGWKPAIQLDDIEETIYFDEKENTCTAKLGGIFVREINAEENITENKK
jgi:hypothetical protein